MLRHSRSFRDCRGQAGFTLLEVMIAVVILSVGLLGMALLQSTSLRAAQTTNERSQATMLVYEMMDMVRSNRRQASQYGLIREGQFFGDGRGGFCAVGAPAPAQRWAADRNEWVCAVRRAIPDARGRVTVTGAVVPVGGGAATPAAIEVRLEWCDPRGGAMSGTPEFAPLFTPGCTGTTNVIVARSGL
jgi:type IV pilus assembly protein PilV